MPEGFHYDSFLSHSSKDQEVVRQLAERLLDLLESQRNQTSIPTRTRGTVQP